MNRVMLTRQLKEDEGLRLKPYRCTENKLTIGYGRNLDARGISEAEAEMLLKNDIERVVTQLKTNSIYQKLDDNRQAVLCNMCFNLGYQGLLSFKRMWAALEVSDYQGAAFEMENSKWYQQVGDRAERLVRIMYTGI